MTIKLHYLGEDDWSRPVYKDEEGRLWKDVEMYSTKLDTGEKVDKSALCTSTNNEFDGEPSTQMSFIEKYKNVEIELFFDEVEKPSKYKFTYQMLGRLKSDCNYFLGYGERYEKHLWAGNVADQIAKMKNLYNSLPEGEKPEWLTYDDILNYEKAMQ